MFVKVQVTTGARKEKFEKIGDNAFSASVREKAERNLANARVCALLSAHFKVPTRAVRIVSGHHAKSKLFNVIK